MADNTSCEGKFDVSETIKGLKAIQREARKSTAALKELSNEQSVKSPMPQYLFIGEENKKHNKDVLIKALAELHGLPESALRKHGDQS